MKETSSASLLLFVVALEDGIHRPSSSSDRSEVAFVSIRSDHIVATVPDDRYVMHFTSTVPSSRVSTNDPLVFGIGIFLSTLASPVFSSSLALVDVDKRIILLAALLSHERDGTEDKDARAQPSALNWFGPWRKYGAFDLSLLLLPFTFKGGGSHYPLAVCDSENSPFEVDTLILTCSRYRELTRCCCACCRLTTGHLFNTVVTHRQTPCRGITGPKLRGGRFLRLR